MEQSGVNLFEAVGFLPDVFDSIYPNMSSLEETDGLLAASISLPVSAFRFRVKFILSKNLTIGLDARASSTSARASSTSMMASRVE